MFRYRRQKLLIRTGGAVFGLTVLFMLIIWILPAGGDKAEKTVRKFYSYEQAGNFSESWEMFHPLMQKRFTKGHYIQDRAHVFLNHFGVETFDFTLGDAEKITNWKMTKDDEPLKLVYKVPVTIIYKGKYGNFSIKQDVFVAEEEGEWKILWDYKK